MHGPRMGEDPPAQSDAARIEAWRRWHEQMAQRHMQGRRSADSSGADWRDEAARDDYYRDDRYPRDYQARGDYAERGPRYSERGGDWGYDEPRRWRSGPDYRAYAPERYDGRGADYYSDRRDWRGPRDRRPPLEEGSGYTYRDHPYRGGGWDERRHGRAPGYFGDRGDWSAQQDWGYRDRWGDRGDWPADARGYRDDPSFRGDRGYRDDRGYGDDWAYRGGRWHDGRWGDAAADAYERYPGQSRGQGMGDMTGRGWGYPDYYQGERGGPMTGER